MKTRILFSLLLLMSIRLSGQDQIATFIKEAQDYLAQKDYKMAQLSLQDAINEINNLIAGQIAEALPDEINGLRSEGEESANTAGMGFLGGGTSVNKRYQHPSKMENSADVSIIANSPMLTTLNMFMGNPSMMGQEYKSVRVGTRRAILKSQTEEYYMDNGSTKQIRSSEIQVPLSQTLITFNLKGFASEQEELAFAAKLDIEKLRVLLGE
ncbi:MAG TPA: hypothetical protein VI603_15810 [Saprospiraceae bacterium]|nr:hypothetical protein [Saprospiraceae bacterium]